MSASTGLSVSKKPRRVVAAKITALPPGRISGQRWLFSRFVESRLVRTCGVPPAAEIFQRPEVLDVGNTIVSSGPQLAPRGTASHKTTGAPPPIGTLVSPLELMNPTHFPSGEKKGQHTAFRPGDRLSLSLVDRAQVELDDSVPLG